ncbi:MAG: hypothetical protein GY898_33560 [Proteobacteria bacterium]|nr:hypothetical protein [Pseudomonadota bacterium]
MSLTVLSAVMLAAATTTSAPAGDWEQVLEEAVPAVVQLKYARPRPFETEGAGTGQATGFVVDAERGIILTNHHVVTNGPVVAEAVFQDHEEVALQAIYRDPVHDFGFFQFDPEDVQFMDVIELELAPEEARVGASIRVVGNDAGDKLSILEGTLARLDVTSPWYGLGRYNDFNTFYYQAASGTSGGSSGSPVLADTGRVVALNAGGKTSAATSYYLPLDRVQRALTLLQAGEPVPRGTIQAEFKYLPFDELERLGLDDEREAATRERFPDGTGLLSVHGLVTSGPGSDGLQPGDILLALEGVPVGSFLQMESTLDDAVGQELVFGILRGGEPLDVPITIQDLHSVAPSDYLEVGAAVLNEFSYQLARTRGMAVGGPYVVRSGYVLDRGGVPWRSVIRSVDGIPTPTLDDFEEVLAVIPDGEYAQIRFVEVTAPNRERVRTIQIDRTWFPMRRCRRDDTSGQWPCADSPAPSLEASHRSAAATVSPRAETKLGRALSPSLVQVQFDIPFRTDGVRSDDFRGTGLVVDAERGLVVVDRDTVASVLGDVNVLVNGAIVLPAEVVWIHPVHNFTVVRYDPSLLPPGTLRSAKLNPKPLGLRDKVSIVGLDANNEVVDRPSKIERIPMLSLATPNVPQFKGTNLDAYYCNEQPPVRGGGLVDKAGAVRALWASFAYQSGKEFKAYFAGVSIREVTDVLPALQAGELPTVRDLGVELAVATLEQARQLGVDDETLGEFAMVPDHMLGVLGVSRRTPGSPAATHLRDGDLILRVNGELAATARVLQEASASPSVELQVLRAGEVRTVVVPTIELGGEGTTRVVQWAGLLLQPPHREVALQTGRATPGVYISYWFRGAPAQRYGVYATNRIVAIDDVPVADLDEFLAQVAGREDQSSVKVKIVDGVGRSKVRTLKLDLVNFPTFELRRTDAGWERLEHE